MKARNKSPSYSCNLHKMLPRKVAKDSYFSANVRNIKISQAGRKEMEMKKKIRRSLKNDNGKYQQFQISH